MTSKPTIHRKDRELVAQMAAAIVPHVSNYERTVTNEHMAVDWAIEVLAEVDSRIGSQTNR